MTLNKRALVVLLPVILLGYAVAAFVGYQVQKASLIGLDKARLAEQLSELQSTFAGYKAFDTGLLDVIRNSSSLLLFINETNDAYRSEALGVGLQESVRSLSSGAVTFVSCAIFQPDHKLIYYYDSSKDPFAGLSDGQLAFAGRAFSGGAVKTSGYITEAGGGSLIVISGFVSSASGAEPVPSQKGGAFMIQIAVRPTRFEQLRMRMEREYGARLELSQVPLEADRGISQAFALDTDLHARLTASPLYLQSPLRRETIALVTGGLGMSLMSVGILMLLVRRYITGPVEHLDCQVTEVMAGRREMIASSGTGEVGRLSANVETLHARATGSLREIQKLYRTDALTGISNRADFGMISARELEHARNTGGVLTMLFMDLDNFKFVNDRYGHEAGDALLTAVAQRLVGILGKGADLCSEPPGSCARLAGDEFAVLIRSDSRGAHVSAVLAGIMDLFKGGFRLGTQLYPVTPSIGIASVPQDAVTVDQLISRADTAMYQAKETGRNNFARYSAELSAKSSRRALIEDGLKALVRDEEFSLVYMPIVSETGVVVACEALLRWASPTLGAVSPAEFIPIAECTGLFLGIDDWVLDHAMADHGRLARLFGEGVVVSINISTAQLYDRSIGVRLGDMARKHGLQPSRVALELTETFAARLDGSTRQAIQSLRLQGFRISIDDFGVGHTSVQQIIEYPADTIKLDRIIVEKLANASNIDGLRSMISFCHALNMKVVAEGVDTIAKVEALAAAGCDNFQGFAISPPRTLEQLGDWRSHLPEEPAFPPGHVQKAFGLEMSTPEAALS